MVLGWVVIGIESPSPEKPKVGRVVKFGMICLVFFIKQFRPLVCEFFIHIFYLLIYLSNFLFSAGCVF